MYRDNSTCSHEQGMQGNLLNKPINHVILAYPLFKQTHFKELPFCHVDMEMENCLVLKGKSSVNGGLSIAMVGYLPD